ncbi:MAG: hypothetical protein HQL06_15390 [Nitrospirae bacterium]|nr:hypothetical protein [Nitrospirota bacterium]
MNESRIFLRGLNKSARLQLAQDVEINERHLYQIGAGLKYPSRVLALKLEIATDGKVKDSDFSEELRSKLLPLPPLPPEESS